MMDDSILTVSQLTRQIKGLVEDRFADVWVSGEVVGFKLHTSGHIYFTLKDDDARLNAVVFRGSVRFLSIPPAQFRDGAQVVCHGHLDVYPPHGAYKLVADQVRLEGMGALLQKLEELKRRLQAEGLFAAERKKPLPFLPDVIGIVTSPTSAAIQDMLRIIQGRFPSHVKLYPAAVQGEAAVEEIVRGLRTLDADEEVDVIIVGRGGGAFEELLPFSDERVVRAVASCCKPVVSAVGHESDFPLCDLAADVRAPTPTAAAQMVVPDRAELSMSLARDRELLGRTAARLLEDAEQDAADRAERLCLASDRHVLACESRVAALAAGLKASHPAQVLAAVAQRASADRAALDFALDRHLAASALRLPAASALDSEFDRYLAAVAQRMSAASALLAELGPETQLARGYSVVRRKADGKVVTDVAQLAARDRVELLLHRGRAEAEVLPAPAVSKADSTGS